MTVSPPIVLPTVTRADAPSSPAPPRASLTLGGTDTRAERPKRARKGKDKDPASKVIDAFNAIELPKVSTAERVCHGGVVGCNAFVLDVYPQRCATHRYRLPRLRRLPLGEHPRPLLRSLSSRCAAVGCASQQRANSPAVRCLARRGFYLTRWPETPRCGMLRGAYWSLAPVRDR